MCVRNLMTRVMLARSDCSQSFLWCQRAPNIGLKSDDCEESPSQSRLLGLLCSTSMNPSLQRCRPGQRAFEEWSITSWSGWGHFSAGVLLHRIQSGGPKTFRVSALPNHALGWPPIGAPMFRKNAVKKKVPSWVPLWQIKPDEVPSWVPLRQIKRDEVPSWMPLW